MNNKLIIGIIVVLLVAGIGYSLMSKSTTHVMNMPQQTTTSATTLTPRSGVVMQTKNAIQITNFTFSPASLTVKVGDKVTWTNNDSVGHSATADDTSFDTGVLANGQSGSTTFSKKGTYTYHCGVHPNMKGTIIVQ